MIDYAFRSILQPTLKTLANVSEANESVSMLPAKTCSPIQDFVCWKMAAAIVGPSNNPKLPIVNAVPIWQSVYLPCNVGDLQFKMITDLSGPQ